MATGLKTKVDYGRLAAIDLTRLCAAHDRGAIEYLLSSNNQRMFRAAWSILRNQMDAEECVQAAYVSAFANMSQFQGRSSLSTWLTRIVINEALMRHRGEERRRQHVDRNGVSFLDDYRQAMMRGSDAEVPDVALAREEIRRLLEQAVAELPDAFRTVFVLREIEGMSSEDTAAVLDLPVATVKTRLFRGRRRLQEKLAPDLAAALNGTFPFAGNKCAALTKRVLDELNPAE